MVNTILKVAAVTSLVLGSIVVAATVFTAKEIDNAGDKLGKKYIELTTTSNKTLFSFGCENNSFAKLL